MAPTQASSGMRSCGRSRTRAAHTVHRGFPVGQRKIISSSSSATFAQQQGFGFGGKRCPWSWSANLDSRLELSRPARSGCAVMKRPKEADYIGNTTDTARLRRSRQYAPFLGSISNRLLAATRQALAGGLEVFSAQMTGAVDKRLHLLHCPIPCPMRDAASKR